MKVYAAAILLAAYVSAADLKELPDEVVIPDLDDDVKELTDEEKQAKYWESVKQETFYWRNWWLGTFQGLYGMGGQVDRPTEECFGDWIPEKRQGLSKVYHTAHNNFWTLTMEDAQNASYDLVDLMFLNDKYCHFRTAFWDVHSYCKKPEDWDDEQKWESPCGVGMITENMQKNAFNIITQVSSAASIFKQQPWEEMDEEARGYALNQMGHSTASLVADLIGFNAYAISK